MIYNKFILNLNLLIFKGRGLTIWERFWV